MLVNLDLIYIFILLFCALFLTIIVILSLYLRILEKYIKLRMAGKSEKDELIIDSANEVAKKIIQGAEVSKKAFDEALVRQTKAISEMFAVKSEEILNKHLLDLDQKLTAKIAEIVKAEGISLSNYQKERLSQIDKEISDTVQKISKDIISREISLAEHKKFILDALEEAKKGGVFGDIN